MYLINLDISNNRTNVEPLRKELKYIFKINHQRVKGFRDGIDNIMSIYSLFFDIS